MFCRLRSFDSGVLVIQALSHSDEEVIRTTKQIVSIYLYRNTACFSNDNNQCCYIAGIWNFFPNSARSHWLLRGHMTSDNETVSRQKSLSGQHCKIYDVRGQQCTVPANVDRRPPLHVMSSLATKQIT